MTRRTSGSDDEARRPTAEPDLTVRVEFVVVDGTAAAAWRARQTTAIRALLEWVAEQRSEDNADHVTQSGASRRRAA